MRYIKVISGCVRVLNNKYCHYLRYQVYLSTQTQKNRLKSRFSPFFCKIGLILHFSALGSGNSWWSSDLEQLVLLEYAISSISNQPKSLKSTKTSFSKIVEKWKSGAHCEGNENRKSQKPFIFANWTILSIFKKYFFWMIQIFQNPDLTSY